MYLIPIDFKNINLLKITVIINKLFWEVIHQYKKKLLKQAKYNNNTSNTHLKNCFRN